MSKSDLGVPGRKSELEEDNRFRMLRLLHENPELSQRDLARMMGISTGSAHYVLSGLIDKGLLKLGRFSASRDKRRYAYILTPKGIAEKARITRRFIARRMAEHQALQMEIEELRRDLDQQTHPALQEAHE